MACLLHPLRSAGLRRNRKIQTSSATWGLWPWEREARGSAATPLPSKAWMDASYPQLSPPNLEEVIPELSRNRSHHGPSLGHPAPPLQLHKQSLGIYENLGTLLLRSISSGPPPMAGTALQQQETGMPPSAHSRVLRQTTQYMPVTQQSLHLLPWPFLWRGPLWSFLES